MSATILVVEDDTTMREMLEYNLKNEGYAVHTASDGREALKLAEKHRPDLFLLDLMLPVIDGYALCDELRKRRPKASIILLTALSGEDERVKGFESGADDFVTKPFSMAELMARIKAKLRREEKEGRNIYESGDLCLDLDDRWVKVGEKEIELRAKEFKLLSLLSTRPGRLGAREEIAAQVWDSSEYASSRTIDAHIKNLRRKIEEPSRYLYIETVRGMGYRFLQKPKLKGSAEREEKGS